jgi:hypothetical protein
VNPSLRCLPLMETKAANKIAFILKDAKYNLIKIRRMTKAIKRVEGGRKGRKTKKPYLNKNKLKLEVMIDHFISNNSTLL